MRPMHPFHRTELLIGGEGYDRLAGGRACVIGLGGVGGYAAEALVRSGFGHLTLVDFDDVCVTNLNRQLVATRKTVRKPKVELMVERAEQINPKAEIVGLKMFYEAETSEQILGDGFDVVIDCIDNMKAKIHLLSTCLDQGQYVVSAMGAGGRLDPTRIHVTDLARTHTDPLARIVRDILRSEHGVTGGFPCVWSDEPPNALDQEAQASFKCICPDKESRHSCERRLQVQGSVSWMPSIFGLTAAGVAVNHVLGREINEPRRFIRQQPSPGKISPERKRELLEQAGHGRVKRG